MFVNNRFHPLTVLRTACIAAGVLTVSCNVLAKPFVLAYTDGQLDRSYQNLQQFHADLSAVGLGSAYGMTATGAIDISGVTSTTTHIINFAKSQSLPVYPTVSDYNESAGGFDKDISRAILTDPKVREASLTNLLKLATDQGFAGIDLDFEAVEPGHKQAFTGYVQALGKRLHDAGLKLIISVPPKMSDAQPEYLGGYDYGPIGKAVDYVQVMTYDQVGPGWSSGGFNGETWPGPESGADWQQALLTYATSRVEKSKVLSGLPTYGYDYSTQNRVNWADYGSVIAAHKAKLHRDSASQTPYATWGPVTQVPDGVQWDAQHAQPVLWYDDAASIEAKTKLVGTLQLGGTSIWAMGYENAQFWGAVRKGLAGAQ